MTGRQDHGRPDGSPDIRIPDVRNASDVGRTGFRTGWRGILGSGEGRRRLSGLALEDRVENGLGTEAGREGEVNHTLAPARPGVLPHHRANILDPKRIDIVIEIPPCRRLDGQRHGAFGEAGGGCDLLPCQPGFGVERPIADSGLDTFEIDARSRAGTPTNTSDTAIWKA